MGSARRLEVRRSVVGMWLGEDLFALFDLAGERINSSLQRCIVLHAERVSILQQSYGVGDEKPVRWMWRGSELLVRCECEVSGEEEEEELGSHDELH